MYVHLKTGRVGVPRLQIMTKIYRLFFSLMYCYKHHCTVVEAIDRLMIPVNEDSIRSCLKKSELRPHNTSDDTSRMVVTQIPCFRRMEYTRRNPPEIKRTERVVIQRSRW